MPKEKTSKKEWKENRPKKLKFSFKEQRDYEVIDDEIASLEEKIAALEAEMAVNATNAGKLREIMIQKEELENTLNEKMDYWVYLNDLAERIEAQNS